MQMPANQFQHLDSWWNSGNAILFGCDAALVYMAAGQQLQRLFMHVHAVLCLQESCSPDIRTDRQTDGFFFVGFYWARKP